MRPLDEIRADYASAMRRAETCGSTEDFIDKGNARIRVLNDIFDLLAELNTAQCAHAFVADSLSYETKRFRDTLAEKDAELRALYGRIEEAEYGMVGGNLVQEAISYQCASGWMRYIMTGKERGK